MALADAAFDVLTEARLCSVGPVVSCLNSSYEGDTLGNLCSVIGNPTPFVTWRKDGKPVNSTLALSRGYKGEYVIEAEGASLVTKVLRPDVMCEYPATSTPGTAAFPGMFGFLPTSR